MTKTNEISVRQLSFFLAFFLPVGKLLELPSLLSKYAGGDLLVPALLGCGTEFFSLLALFLFSKKTGMGILEFVEEKLGEGFGKAARLIFAAVLLLYAVPFLLDLEKFSHSVFSDTEPTFFSFAPFFIFCAFCATKGIKAIGRSADLCPLLFLVPFLGLMVLSIGSSDLSNLLPFFEKPFSAHFKANMNTSAFWSSGILMLPLFGGYKYQKGDGKKLFFSYLGGAVCVLAFLAVFYGLYGPLGAKEHFALSKIGLYFPALATLGRTDLLLVYLMTVVLFFFTALPVQLAVDCIAKSFRTDKKTLPSFLVNLGLFIAVLFLNRLYDSVYPFFQQKLSFVFLFFGQTLPQLFLLFTLFKKKGAGTRSTKNKEKSHAR